MHSPIIESHVRPSWHGIKKHKRNTHNMLNVHQHKQYRNSHVYLAWPYYLTVLSRLRAVFRLALN